MTATFDLISVNWNEEQARVWLHWVKRHCPTAAVHLVKDTKPVPWCWSSGKLNCFKYDDFQTDRIIYLDTDTIVTKDLEFVFDEMGDCCVGLSSDIEIYKFHKVMRKQVESFSAFYDYNWPPKAWSSGMMVLKGMDPMELHEGWMHTMLFPPFRKIFPRHQLLDEIALGLWLTNWLPKEDMIWDIPKPVHGNVIKKPDFGGAKVPAVIHYHKPERLKRNGMDKWLKIP